MREGWHSIARSEAPAMVAASGCAPPMPPGAAVENPLAGECAAVGAPSHLGEGFVGALHNSLRADVDPGARRHLPEHHQALAVERIEMIERRPMRHEV